MPLARRNPESGTIDGEHGIIGGQTRFGKTYLSKRIARFHRHVIVHDPKNRYTLGRPDELRIRHVEDLYDVNPERDRIVIYAPPADEADDLRANDEFCEYVFKRGRCLVIFDELVRLGGDSHHYPKYMRYLYTAGAEDAICCLGLTQEPVWIPSFVQTQSAHVYAFFTANRSHREKIAGLMPIEPDRLAELKKCSHTADKSIEEGEFYYWRNDMRAPEGPLYL